MHACFPPFGIYPNNAIVGGSAPIAAGAALFRLVNGEDGIVVANLGDGAAAFSVVWESLNLASMHQYGRLWGDPPRSGVADPLLLRQQLLCDGWSDRHRDDGVRPHRPDRGGLRGDQPARRGG